VNRSAIFADALLTVVICFVLSALSSANPSIILVTSFWLILLYAVIIGRLTTVKSKASFLLLVSILFAVLLLLVAGSQSLLIGLSGWLIFSIRQFRDITDYFQERRLWRRLFIDAGAYLLILIVNSGLAPSAQAEDALFIASGMLLRIVSLRSNEVLYARSRGVSYVRSIARSTMGLTAFGFVFLLVLIFLHGPFFSLITAIAYPIIWLIASPLFWLLSLIHHHKKPQQTVRVPMKLPHRPPTLPAVTAQHTLFTQGIIVTLIIVLVSLTVMYIVKRLRRAPEKEADTLIDLIVTRTKLRPDGTAQEAPTKLRQLFTQWVLNATSVGAIHRKKSATPTSLLQETIKAGVSGIDSVRCLVEAYEKERYGNILHSDEVTASVRAQLEREGWLNKRDKE